MDSTLTDPLGRSFVLHDRTWFGHILRGHPEIEPYRDLVEAAIQRPITIRRSVSEPACRLFFGDGPPSGNMMLVVADTGLGLVKTAHLARKLSGGDEEWSRPTQ